MGQRNRRSLSVRRSAAGLLVLCLVAAACGDGSVFGSSTSAPPAPASTTPGGPSEEQLEAARELCLAGDVAACEEIYLVTGEVITPGVQTTVAATGTPSAYPGLTEEQLEAARNLCRSGDVAACDELFFVTGEAISPDAQAYGDDPVLDVLYDHCREGNAAACKALLDAAPPGSSYLDVQFAGLDGGVGAVVAIAAPAIEAQLYGDDATLDGLWDACAAAGFDACDQLYLAAPSGSAYEAFGAECGGLGGYPFGCLNQFGVQVMLDPDLVVVDSVVIDPGQPAQLVGSIAPATIRSFDGPDRVTPPAVITISWATENGDCGVYLNGIPVQASGSANYQVPENAQGPLSFTLVARDATCDDNTRAYDRLLIPVERPQEPTAPTTTTTLAEPAVFTSRLMYIIEWQGLDLDLGGPGGEGDADILWVPTCATQADADAVLEYDPEGAACYRLISTNDAAFKYPLDGAGTYADCLATLPRGILVLEHLAVSGERFPTDDSGSFLQFCYRTSEGRLGVMRITRYALQDDWPYCVPGGPEDPPCLSPEWALSVDFRTWASP